MAINYTNLLSKVKSIINDNGRSITLVKKNDTPSDSSTPWKGLTGTDIETPATGVVGKFNFMEQDGELVRRGDKKILVHADLGVQLDEYDQVFDGSTKWNIVAVEKVAPASTELLYILQVRL